MNCFVYQMMETPMSEPFFTNDMKMPNRPDGFILYCNLAVDFFSSSKRLYTNMKNRLRLIGARPKFCMTFDNLNVSLRFVECSLYTHRIAFKYDCRKEKKDMLALTPLDFNYLETLAKTFFIPAREN